MDRRRPLALREPKGTGGTARDLRLLGLAHVAGIAYPIAVIVALPSLPAAQKSWYVLTMLWALGAIIALVVLYLIRHYIFTLNRLFGRQRHPYVDVETADWPHVTVLIPAHNEELVIERILRALLQVDYPQDRLTIMPIDDRSKDTTADILTKVAAERADVIRPLLRRDGEGGKGAALRWAMQQVTTDLVLVFDADYVPGRGLIKQLVAPFFDPEVGAVMGRVIPSNTQTNLLTRLLDLERSGGYQVDQQARMNLKLVPQYGGTVGGVRVTALEAVGGWKTDTLAEDTDATYRLLLAGWKTVYQNRSECYEEVPERWDARMRQVVRWARGHNQAMARYTGPLVRNRRTRWGERVDGLLLLGVYSMSPLLLVGWALAMALWYMGVNQPGLIVLLAVCSYSTVGNFATFFEVAAAAHLDGTRERVRLIPFIAISFLVTTLSVTGGTVRQLIEPTGRALHWHRTARRGAKA